MNLAEIWRHPVKSLGAEQMQQVVLEAGKPMPWDRVWAIAHGASTYDPAAPAWQPRKNFIAQAHVPEVVRIAAQYDEAASALRLTHPRRPDLTVSPGTEAGGAALTDWAAPLAEGQRPGPYVIAHVPGHALADMPDPWVSVLSLASLRALSQHAGQHLDPRRFRGNLWLDGGAAWEEEDWPGEILSIGPVRLRVIERIERCRATEANPAKGTRDIETLQVLRATRGSPEFGIYAEVIEGGKIAVGDSAGLASGA
ncbi:MAG: MOSC domain-containing protein [Pseudomonadota bacterium]